MNARYIQDCLKLANKIIYDSVNNSKIFGLNYILTILVTHCMNFMCISDLVYAW